MKINLEKLQYTFKKKPLLVGGKAMEYYHLRKAGGDIDLVAAEEDVVALIKQYPTRVKNLWEDLGVCPYEFEIWRTIRFLDYAYLKEGAVEKKDFLIISLEKLLFMKVLAMKEKKYLTDTKLIVAEIIKQKYEAYSKQETHNKILLKDIQGITYIERLGPQE